MNGVKKGGGPPANGSGRPWNGSKSDVHAVFSGGICMSRAGSSLCSRRMQAFDNPLRVASAVQDRVNVNAFVFDQIVNGERESFHKHPMESSFAVSSRRIST